MITSYYYVYYNWYEIFFDPGVIMFKDLTDRRKEITIALTNVMRTKRMSRRVAARKIGIAEISLQRFFDDKNSHYVTLIKIDDFVNEQMKPNLIEE